MKFLTAKAKALRVGWNKRPLSEADFHLLRERHGVLLIEVVSEGVPWEGLEWTGYYTTVDGVPAIVINAALRGIERLRVLLHEFGHHLLHAPDTCFFDESSVQKTEVEAEVFALVALIPRRMLGRLSSWKMFEDKEDLFPAKLVTRRLEIRRLHGL